MEIDLLFKRQIQLLVEERVEIEFSDYYNSLVKIIIKLEERIKILENK